MYPSELTNAYNVLRNLTSRREYDKEIGAYFTMRSTKKKQTEEKVLRLTDEMLEIDMKGIGQVLCVNYIVTEAYRLHLGDMLLIVRTLTEY